MNESIYIETLDTDAANPLELVMLHGWAMHGGLMKGLAEKLSAQFRVHLVDLPGHGLSQLEKYPDAAICNLSSLAHDIHAAVQQKLKNDAVWLGWSLGGLIAIKIAEQFPQSVNRLILLASTPAFVKQHDWPYAVDKTVFEKFASDLASDSVATIMRFLSLQVRGTENSRQTLKQLREIVFAKDVASKEVLLSGLNLLEKTDLRKLLENLNVPILILGGERDTLVPQAALHELAKRNKNSETSIIDKAGHAPFLSQPEQCAEAITRFCHV
jgi:pimeloyl-[acyl-carrier protein] methyl ester esterase